jgi:hypothetical protein
MEINLSKLDQLRFGITTVKAKINNGDSIEELIAKSVTLGAELVIVRLPTHCIQLAQDLEQAGALLTDTLVYFQKKKISTYEINLPTGYLTQAAQSEDAMQMESVALESFKGYAGHYHADPQLRQEDCDAVYSTWAKNSCTKGDLADEVILIKKNEKIAAFATLKKINSIDYEGILFGVASDHQGKGLYLNLMQLSCNWGMKNNMKRLLTSTQITNVTVQKNWCRVGMEPLSSFYTFHLWMKK